MQLALILLFALALRVLLAIQMGNRIYFTDTLEYQKSAESLLAGHGPGGFSQRAPVYPMFMALGFRLFGHSYAGVRALQLFVGLGIVAVAALLAGRIGTQSHALLTAILTATAPSLVFSSGMLYPTAVYSLLLLGVTFAARELDLRPSIGRCVVLGILAAVTLMTDLISVIPIGCCLIWLASGVRRHGPRIVIFLVVAVLVAGSILVPIVRYYEHSYGRPPIFMNKAQTVLWFARRDPELAAGRVVHDTTSHFVPLTTRQFVAREWQLMREQPVPYVMDYTSELVHFFKPMPDRIQTRNVYTSSLFKVAAGAYFIPVILFGMVGLLAAPVRRRDRVLLALVPLSTAAAYSLFFTQLRYRVPVEPQLLILATLGATRLLPQICGLLVGMPPAETSAAENGPSPPAWHGTPRERQALPPEARP